MAYVVDIGLLLVLLICIFVGAKKGIARSALELVAFFLAIFLSGMLAKPAAEAVYTGSMSEKVQTKIEEKLDSKFTDNGGDTISVVTVGLPSFLEPYADAQAEKINTILEEVSKTTNNPKELAVSIEEKLVAPIAISGISVMLFLLLTVLMGAVFHALAVMLAKLFKLPIIGAVNAILGGVFGAIKGIAFVCILAVILLFITPQIGGNFEKIVLSSELIRLLQAYLPSLITL